MVRATHNMAVQDWDGILQSVTLLRRPLPDAATQDKGQLLGEAGGAGDGLTDDGLTSDDEEQGMVDKLFQLAAQRLLQATLLLSMPGIKAGARKPDARQVDAVSGASRMSRGEATLSLGECLSLIEAFSRHIDKGTQWHLPQPGAQDIVGVVSKLIKMMTTESESGEVLGRSSSLLARLPPLLVMLSRSHLLEPSGPFYLQSLCVCGHTAQGTQSKLAKINLES